MTQRRIPWKSGTWTREPVSLREEADDERLVVEAAEGSDFWERTVYGFEHRDGHALLAPWPGDAGVEVSFSLTGFDELYDQAGLMLWNGPTCWIKAGIEINDGVPHVGAVVTDGMSDWSLAPVPEWLGQVITLRASRMNDGVIVRARTISEPWRTIRVAPFAETEEAQAGPYLCAPSRAGFTVTFTGWMQTEPDDELHADPPDGD
jgi:regulation of enolase protein 1 (concanavalin A-like superfamily)